MHPTEIRLGKSRATYSSRVRSTAEWLVVIAAWGDRVLSAALSKWENTPAWQEVDQHGCAGSMIAAAGGHGKEHWW